jgi:hypothetical protein
MALAFPVTNTVVSAHGRKYIIDGLIDSPSGASAAIRTVWIIEQGESIPRLVTAYPRRRRT